MGGSTTVFSSLSSSLDSGIVLSPQTQNGMVTKVTPESPPRLTLKYLCTSVQRLEPQNERCQLIKAHMSSGEITGAHFQSLENLIQKVVLLLIWLHSLVCQIHKKQMSQLVACSGNICVWVVSCNEHTCQPVQFTSIKYFFPPLFHGDMAILENGHRKT